MEPTFGVLDIAVLADRKAETPLKFSLAFEFRTY